MDRNIKIIALGGLDEVGKEMYAIEIDGDIFVYQCGVKFPDRMTPGIDYIIARFDYLFENKDRVRAYIIGHGHDQAMGALPYVIRKVPAPVYCTSATKLMIETFLEHVHMEAVNINFNIVNCPDTKMISGRKFRFVEVAHHAPQTMATFISTDYGSIVLMDSFMINNDFENGFMTDIATIGEIIHQEKVLLLLSESVYADKTGYTAPRHDITYLIEKTIKTSKGRIFMSMLAPDIYSITKVIQLAIKYNKKIVAYDNVTADFLYEIAQLTKTEVPSKNVGKRDDINRYKPDEVLVIMTGFGTRLYSQITLLAKEENDDKRFKLNSTDTFIVSTMPENNTESAHTETLDELFKANVNVVYFPKGSFLRMHASQEDLKYIISMMKPKYYLPISGTYSSLINNAMLAISQKTGLNFSNTFVMDNGNILEINDGVASIKANKVMSGDLYVDGTGLGKGNQEVMDERTKLGDNGVVILAATFSKETRTIIYGPDVQTRGFVFLKESEQIIKDMTKLFIATLNDEIRRPAYNLKNVKYVIEEAVFRYVRRVTQRTPIIIPVIVEVE